MKLCSTRFAFAAAVTMTLTKAIKMYLWRPLIMDMPMFKGMWRYHHGLGVKYFPTTAKELMQPCAWHFPVIRLTTVFFGTFLAVLFFAWFYNWLVGDK